jgi:hypothetical protein
MNDNVVTPAKAGVQGNRYVARLWIPAFAGKTRKIRRAL